MQSGPEVLAEDWATSAVRLGGRAQGRWGIFSAPAVYTFPDVTCRSRQAERSLTRLLTRHLQN